MQRLILATLVVSSSLQGFADDGSPPGQFPGVSSPSHELAADTKTISAVNSASLPADKPAPPPPRPLPGLGATEEEVRMAHGEPDAVFCQGDRTSFLFNKHGRFEFENGRVIRMKRDGKTESVMPQVAMASHPLTIRVHSAAPGNNARPPGPRDRSKIIITTHSPPAIVPKP